MLIIFNYLLIWNCLFASLVIICNNSLYALICLIFVIIGSCLSLFFFKIEFLVFIILLVYLGAIIVLFLFIIMMLELNQDEKKKISFNSLFISLLIFLKLAFILFYFSKQLALTINSFSHEYIKYNEDLDILYHFMKIEINDINFFINLFTQKYFIFIFISIILLFSMMGSIALCIKPKTHIIL